VFTLTLFLVVALAGALDPALLDLVSAAGVVATSLALGFLKKHTGALDGAIGHLVKPVQPALLLAVGIGLPWLTAQLGIAGPVDPAVFVTAPTATVLAVTFRELNRRLFTPKPS
jgi:hypothetical protein